MAKEEVKILEFAESMIRLQRAGVPVPEHYDVLSALKKAGFKAE
jgi:hypothetical protein